MLCMIKLGLGLETIAIMHTASRVMLSNGTVRGQLGVYYRLTRY